MENKTTIEVFTNGRLALPKVSVLLVTMLLFAFTSNAQVYVKKGATGLNDGTSWTDAFTDLQAALTDASISGATEIWVARGEYKPTTDGDRTKSFELLPNVSLLGGFEGIETLASERDHRLFRTVLSGDIGEQFVDTDNSYRVVLAENMGSNAIIDGFVIKKGYSYIATGGNYANCGAGLLHFGDEATSNFKVLNCTFQDNQTSKGGGFTNFASPNGKAHVILQNCTFMGNKSISGGALTNSSNGALIDDVSMAITNCIFTNNEAESQGGAIFSTSNSIITNTTFAENKISGSAANFGGGVYHQGGSLTIKNSILWGNYKEQGGTIVSDEIGIFSSPSIIQNNIIQGGYGVPSDNNIDEDPMFEELPTVEGVNPSTSIIPVGRTDAYYEKQLDFSGNTLLYNAGYYVYKDHAYNKIYYTSQQLQSLDYNNLTDGKPTSTVYTDLWYTGINKMENAVSTTTNKIYFGTPRDQIYWIDRATGESGKIDPLEGITHSLIKIGQGVFT